MLASSTYAVRNLRINQREREIKNRKRLGFSVYFSRYFFDFNQLTLQQQQQHIFESSGTRVGAFRVQIDDDNSSIDSTNSIWKEKVSFHDIHRAACFNWRNNLSEEVKNAWVRRARKLNSRKLPGRFLQIPFNVGREGCNTLENSVLDSISFEWDTVAGFFKNFLTRIPKTIISSKI